MLRGMDIKQKRLFITAIAERSIDLTDWSESIEQGLKDGSIDK